MNPEESITLTGRTLRTYFGKLGPEYARRFPFVVDAKQAESLVERGVKTSALDGEFCVMVCIPVQIKTMPARYNIESTQTEIKVFPYRWTFHGRSGTTLFLVP